MDVTAEALEIRDDGGFTSCGELGADECAWAVIGDSPCDFHSLRRVSGASKRLRDDKVGAFGIGFTAVYQLTDAPTIVSNGQHWILDEAAPPGSKIRVCQGRDCELDHNESGTRISLPWAMDPDSDLRRRLRSDAVTEDDKLELLVSLVESVPRALLFLQHLSKIEIRHDGDEELTVVKERSNGRTTIRSGLGASHYLVLTGTIADEQLEGDDPYGIVAKRRRGVEVAIPAADEEGDRGLFYAFLPTEEDTQLPFHVNADFFPASDRRRLLWSSKPEREFNRAALDRAGAIVAHKLEVLREDDQLGGARLWQLLVGVRDAGRNAGTSYRDESIGRVWTTIRERAREANVVKTSIGQWRRPVDVWLPPPGIDAQTETLLERLGLAIPERTIRPSAIAAHGRRTSPREEAAQVWPAGDNPSGQGPCWRQTTSGQICALFGAGYVTLGEWWRIGAS
jgi:hypothetical protein